MPSIPDLRPLLSLLRRAVDRRAEPWRRRASIGSGRSAGRRHPGRRGRRRQSLGSALVQALMAGLIAVIAAFLLASRLMASRFGNFSRSDVQSAREAAEFGLNEIQARLNSNQFGYLWVTKFRDSSGNQFKDASGNLSWGNVSASDLSDCGMVALNSSGASITPGIPAGVASERVITDSSGGRLAYQVTDFTPPALPDSLDTTTAQSDFCTTAAVAREFGNLNGGSALITVTGTLTRNGVKSSFKLRRRTHVLSPSGELKYSFMILGDATPRYTDADNNTIAAFGASGDIAQLNRGDGDICYGTISNTTCATTPPLPRTIIGCFDLESCLVNNVTSLSTKEQLANCGIQTVGGKKKKKVKSYICNSFQQAGPLPNTPTPTSEGFTGYTSSAWSTYASKIDCEIGNSGANDYGNCESQIGTNPKQTRKKSFFPYYDRSSLPTMAQARALTNANLVRGCYFNNTDGSSTSTGANSTAINCLIESFTISKAGKNDPNLIVYTTAGQGSATDLLPVNIFLHGPGNTTVNLKDGGISNSASGVTSWTRLRIYGKQVDTSADSSVSCSQSTSITSTANNDLTNLFLWLPNAALNYQKAGSNDNSYVVIWTCKFTGPTKDAKKGNYSIITPIPEKTIRIGLSSTSLLGSDFISTAGGSYRGLSSEDTPVP